MRRNAANVHSSVQTGLHGERSITRIDEFTTLLGDTMFSIVQQAVQNDLRN